MGVFHEVTAIVNRAPIDLSVTFDGQDLRLKPGPGFLPVIALPYAMNQNVIMGSVDHTNPHISGGRYLLGVVNDPDYPCDILTKAEWQAHLDAPGRVNEQVAFEEKYGSDPKAKLVVRGKGRAVAATSRAEVAGSGGNAVFTGDR